MDFTVIPVDEKLPKNSKSQVFLVEDNWDDWFQFSTSYVLIYVDRSGTTNNIGSVKIGQFNMTKDQRRPDLPQNFKKLDSRFFSLGQDETYYEDLNLLGDILRNDILDSLNDLARDSNLFEIALKEKVTGVSLLRSVTKSTVRGQFNRLSRGGAKLSEYQFSYVGPRQMDRRSPPVNMSFSVKPGFEPPTNIHVLIGRNGVGKTHLLNSMTRALVQKDADVRDVGEFQHNEDSLGADLFANIVSVTFSAFDPFTPLPESRDKSTEVRYSYIGLKKKSQSFDEKSGVPKTPNALGAEFGLSAKVCSQGARVTRWRRALKALEADPIFRMAGISDLADEEDDDEFKKQASKIFSNLSSGHKIVLLTITRLVETVEERTLVILDEPEAHLHPPLLSAFIRSLSDLLIDRNGVAIIATHSPVVLQEVPKRCVWKIRRNGGKTNVERSEIETFGENVGILTREVFGLEVTDSGFHKILRESIEEYDTYEEVIEHFNGELGEEAKAIIRGLMILKSQRDT